MKIRIITDGNKTLGLGHIYQSVTLANYLKNDKRYSLDISFITKSDNSIAKLIKDAGYKVMQLSTDEDIFSLLKKEKTDKIIFDKLDVSSELAKKIKSELNGKLIIFTNLTKANEYADISVTADLGKECKNIFKLDPITGQIKYNGPKYWILRPEFFRYKELNSYLIDTINKILIIFGGVDPKNYSSLVLNEILKMNDKFQIQLILGSAFEYQEEIYKIIKQNISSRSEISILRNVSNVAQLMFESDLVFTSPGLSFFEALFLEKPVILFHQNKQQIEEFRGLIPSYGINHIHLIPSLISNRDFISITNPVIRNMEIGMGKDEIIDRILN
jgi:Spore coat polysaccharide biosynthesis protein, predicted glycosyltransferase